MTPFLDDLPNNIEGHPFITRFKTIFKYTLTKGKPKY